MVIGQCPSIDEGHIEFSFANTTGRERGRNRGALGKKASSKAVFLIFPLHNSSEDAILLLLLHSLIVLSSLRLLAVKLTIDVFSKDNVETSRGYDLRNTGADEDEETRADAPGTEIDADVRADNLGTTANNPGMVADNPGIATDDPGTAANDPGIKADSPSITAEDPGIGTDEDIGADDSRIAASNKACAASLFALCHALFLLVFSSESVTTSLPYSLPFSSSNTLQSKLILSCSVTLVKRRALFFSYPIDEMWIPSLDKVSSRMSTIVKLL